MTEEYKSKYTGQEIDRRLEQVEINNNNITDVTSQLAELSGKKVDKIDGRGLSTNDYTNEDKGKVKMILSGRSELSNVDDIDTYFPSGSVRIQQGYHSLGGGNFSIGGLIIERTCVSAGISNGRVFIGLSDDEDSENNPNKIVIGKATGTYSLNPGFNVYYLEDYLHDIATQSEIDALFEESSNGGSSTSY